MKRHCESDLSFTLCTITGRKVRVHEYNPETKQQSYQLKTSHGDQKCVPDSKQYQINIGLFHNTKGTCLFDTKDTIYKQFVPPTVSI